MIYIVLVTGKAALKIQIKKINKTSLKMNEVALHCITHPNGQRERIYRIS
jgi:hypothetical protein